MSYECRIKKKDNCTACRTNCPFILFYRNANDIRFRNRHQTVDIEEVREFSRETSDTGILEALMRLPEKFRLVLILYYVEEYPIEVIAKVIGRTTSAVKIHGRSSGRGIYAGCYRIGGWF